MIKAVAADAKCGAELREVVRIGEKLNAMSSNVDTALTACSPPIKGSSIFEPGRDHEIEMDVGI